MQIHSINFHNLETTSPLKNSNKRNNFNLTFGQNSDDVNIHNSKEYEYAKEHLGEEDWEEKYFKKRYEQIYPSKEYNEDEGLTFDIFINFALLFIPAIIDECVIDKIKEAQVKKTIAPEIRRIRDFMFEMNNKKISDLLTDEKQLNTKLSKEKNREYAIKTLFEKFINPLNENAKNVPTAIMIESSDEQERKDIVTWTKEQVVQNSTEFILPKNEDDALYRIMTEIEYAQDYYDKTGKRTVLFIDNFANILTSSQVSGETIAEMKSLLSDISEEKAPVSIVFDIDDSSVLDSAFTGNKSRIPLSINLNNK
ncbi:MAG: hypothetical protein LUH05_04955 [Candidatus Gastranaerophilales bacterium]|nr:hypothetical protein [Candidatus Gastranaerophilales bacterium]